MRKIIASINIDSDNVRLVVGEFFENHLNILSASKISSNGIQDGKIIDAVEASNSIKNAVREASRSLGTDIKRIILGIDARHLQLIKSSASIGVKNKDGIITGEEVEEVLYKSGEEKVPAHYALTGIIPVEFLVDSNTPTKDPKGISSQNLGVKSILSLSPKNYVVDLLSLMKESGLKVVDVVLNPLGDYQMFKNSTTEKEVGVIINLGFDISTVSVYNRGILTNAKSYRTGVKTIIGDISYVYKIDDGSAEGIYKDLALANTRLANPNEYRLVTTLDREKIKVTEHEVSEIASSRIVDMLNLFKNSINTLTKKEISYIIVTGALTELKDFKLTLEGVFGKNVYLGEVKQIGARENGYVSSIGVIKYYEADLELKEENFSIFSESEIDEINESGTKSGEEKDSLFSKVFGYFFDS